MNRLRRAAPATTEQQKRKGPELPLVPVKRQRHELLLGAEGLGPGSGTEAGGPGSFAASGVSKVFLPSSPNHASLRT